MVNGEWGLVDSGWICLHSSLIPGPRSPVPDPRSLITKNKQSEYYKT